MTAVIDRPADGIREQRIQLDGIPWERFEQLSGCFEDTRAVRLTYIEGSLEIMAPIEEAHENLKKNISYLLETYLNLRGIRFYGRGGFTLKQPGRAAGEPDESYCFGTDKPVPDLVIEVVVSRDALSKLPLYQALAIPEVWIWRDGQLEVRVLDGGSYRRSPSSRLLPHLDIGLLADHVQMSDQYDAVRAFRRKMSGDDRERTSE
jgi:Uma2 family endonuclease